MLSLRYTGGFGILQRARDGGEIVVGKDGLPTPIWNLSDFDRGVMRKGLDGLAQILEAGGARRIYTSHAGWVSYDPGNEGRDKMLQAADDCGWGPAQVTLGTFHLMGTPTWVAPRVRRVRSQRQAWDARNLFVVDGAVLPTALEVNPMITIEAAAHKIARGIASKLT
jgi:choline dehydrogenase-like flavoprotein